MKVFNPDPPPDAPLPSQGVSNSRVWRRNGPLLLCPGTTVHDLFSTSQVTGSQWLEVFLFIDLSVLPTARGTVCFVQKINNI